MYFLYVLILVLPVVVVAFTSTKLTVRAPVRFQHNQFYALSPDKQFEILSAAAVTVENATALAANATAAATTATNKRRKVNPRDLTGYNYRDNEGEYDVPIINEPMWCVE
jgi:ABC-type spermidine/putrescine transport system permease subunit II